ncbi:phage holin family protein [Deinococcus sp. Leaf326]|uniref:phage holin family protein n=1 Tax=Deinococcus sp. Leaf326 TaxID=1736338 RepID=UPI0019107971|nr:phage holin family protein [Deinococcus sp. Leaf326]
MEEKKSMGGALIDVFDAALVLVKSELSGLLKKLTAVIKAKGLGVVLMLGAVGPLLLGLVFLILFVFYGLMRLGLGAWAAALLIALFSFALTAALIVLGLKKLSADDDLGQPKRKEGPMTEDERLEAQYQADKRAEKARADHEKKGAAVGTPAGSVPLASVTLGKGREPEPVGVPGHVSTTGTSGRDPSSQYTDQATGGVRPNPEIPRDAINYAAGESRVLNGEDGAATVRVEGGTVTVPVYETDEDGKPQMYSTGINDKLEGSTLPAGPAPSHGGGHGHKKHDPNIQEPVVLKDAPGIPVSTAPTYREDMKEAEVGASDTGTVRVDTVKLGKEDRRD